MKDAENQMKLVAVKNDDWIRIAISFGLNKQTAEDLVQEMYIKIFLKLKDGTDIMYDNNEINYYYIFNTLRWLFLDLKRKHKNIYKISIDNLQIESYDVNYDETVKKVQKALSNMYWYDRKVFEVINNGESVAEFSRKSLIEYYELYNTHKKVKNKLKKLL
jgi:DNA-directed RNA polymerase specialized sigma24 family protein